MVLPTIWMLKASLLPPVGTPAFKNSSAMMTFSRAVRPPPPYSAGHDGANRLLADKIERHSAVKVASCSGESAPIPFQSAGRCSPRKATIFSR